MTATTTAYMFVSPQGSGPFNVPSWSIGISAQLVEGSGQPYWLCRSPESTQDRFVPIPTMDAWTVAQSVLFLLALEFSNENQMKIFEEHHNATWVGDSWQVAECWDLSDEEVAMAKEIVQNRIRIGVALLDDGTLFTSEAAQEILNLGLVFDIFDKP